MSDYSPWVVCAAMKMKDGLVIPGARHFSPEMRAVLHRIYGEGYHLKVEEMGFIDQRGAFLTREEALIIALANGQRRKRCGGDEKKLYSENLF